MRAHLLVRLQMFGEQVVLVEPAAAHLTIEAAAAMLVHVIAEYRRCAERGRTEFATIRPATRQANVMCFCFFLAVWFGCCLDLGGPVTLLRVISRENS